MSTDTPRTDAMVTGNSDPCRDEYENLAAFTRQLEREGNAIRVAAKRVCELYQVNYLRSHSDGGRSSHAMKQLEAAIQLP